MIFFLWDYYDLITRVIIFGSVWFLSKKVTKLNFFLKTKTGSNWPVLVKKPTQTDLNRFWFGFLGKKPVQTGLARFFLVWLGFFPVWLGFFFRIGFDSVRFFSFRLIKPKLNRTGQFFQNFNRFFSRFGFFGYFFSFSRFFGFFAHPYL